MRPTALLTLLLLLCQTTPGTRLARAGQLTPTNYDQYLLELTNRGRANPTSEAARYGIDLNEGLAAGTISAAAKQPLAFNLNLNASADSQSQWMLANNAFSHTGAGGSQPNDRMAAAGYAFNPPWTWAENIGWVGQVGSPPDPATTVAQIYQGLFVDTTVPDRGHRINLMNPTSKEIGVGVSTGLFTQLGTTYNAVMATQDFASQAGNSFLTGVAYNNSNHTNFYDPNLGGYGNVTVTATQVGTGTTFSTTTFASGGYTLAVPNGTYSVGFAGTGVPYLLYKNISVNDLNVAVDASNTLAAHPWQNPVNPLDVLGTGTVVPQDALIIINELAKNTSHALTTPAPGTVIPYYYDVSGNINSIIPQDALLIINYLEAHPNIASSAAVQAAAVPNGVGTAPAGQVGPFVLGDASPLLAPVPEPSSWLLAITSLAGSGLWVGRRRFIARRPRPSDKF
jgi:uncharacterized protein YkwD